MDVGKRMREIRKGKKLKQVDIAKLMDVPESNVSFWERQSVLRSDVIEKFCKALKMELYKFYAPDDLPPLDLSPDEQEIINMFRAVPKELHPGFVQLNAHTLKLLKESLQLITKK